MNKRTSMHKNFYAISQKINAIQCGLLRHRTKKATTTHHVVMKVYDENTIVCAVTDQDRPEIKKLAGRRVNLVQKSNNDYIYLSGIVLMKPGLNKRTLYIRLTKACWFIKKSKGTLSWLQEKHVHEFFLVQPLEMAS